MTKIFPEIGVVVRIVKPRSANHPDYRRVDFDDNDAMEYGVFAKKSQAWRTTCEFETSASPNGQVETAVAIAAPDGRVAVWYGYACLFQPTRSRGKMSRKRQPAAYDAAYAATKSYGVAAQWNVNATRGGPRDVTPLAMAASRVLHAEAFGDVPSTRDLYLAELAVLKGSTRPATSRILRADDSELAAASALVVLKNYDGVRALFARKGVTA